MNFENEVFDWENAGTEPSEDRKTKGFETGYKPPAGIFNAFWHRVTRAIKELQTKFGSHADNKENPHEVTTEQLGLDKVDNTSDAEKSVKFASEAKEARKVQHALSVRFKGGSTEGTDLWTFDGSTSRSINITPPKIGAADSALSNVDNMVFASKVASATSVIVDATSEDGVVYNATINGLTELKNGMEITIIPNIRSTSKTISLNINNWGAVAVRQPLSFSTFVATAPDRDYFLYENTPCRLMYHANYTSGGIWLMADKQKTSAQDLYGTLPIEGGGTGATTAAQAREKLGLSFLEHLHYHTVRIKMKPLSRKDYSAVDKEIHLIFNYTSPKGTGNNNASFIFSHKGVNLPYVGYVYYAGSNGSNEIIGYTFEEIYNDAYLFATLTERVVQSNSTLEVEYAFLIDDIQYEEKSVVLY